MTWTSPEQNPDAGPVGGPAARFAASALAGGGRTGTAAFHAWLADCRARFRTRTELRPLDRLDRWTVDPETGDITHDSGRFFTVRGLDIQVPGAAVERWSQPIISQPEIGILGILVKEFDGVLHCLLQAKAEPGNINGVQLSPTVQATRSNYTGVHRGKAVSYLEYFRNSARHRVLADVRQSEQGAWFHRKRNRNMVVEVTGPVDVLDGFCWLTLGQLHQLLLIDDLVNMDTRTVLSCLPVTGPWAADSYPPDGAAGSGFRHALIRSLDTEAPAVHPTDGILSWITGERTRQELLVREIPLRSVRSWHRVDGRISHEDGLFFDIVGVGVEAVGREVGHWDQPMLAPRGTGLVALLVREIDGVLHALMHAKVEPGHLDVLELAPTVQCTPQTYDHLPRQARPRFLDEVLGAAAQHVRFTAVHSEEGGRFLHARTRYMIVETGSEVPLQQPPEFRWLTLHQLGALLRHSYYLNMQARSIVACLHSLAGGHPPGGGVLPPLESDCPEGYAP
ncbi:NDP-hexose 2,3-dehydratase family protein [Streptomyces sp. ACA25]|uniref:NDP-hexose 2,3-dehydratase family protein n=1 Tax=Streptomyces sp. ACA25 TaxID=3022596 RepID=UPI0023077A9E|nr:NDP-hexose 2,3-dehydratase family protein [Streptomyces sp. ACA25]MDB1090147.1 NDP-hexose 2,3-dehydratase family protein [Streptomyces sp. ACA25]